MSEELDWELYDIFEAGLFPFPIYDHQTARKIIRYLLYRGVLDEEIADAIEDSTADLHIWLNRSGKNMVGEWVIAWVNDVRDEYRKEKQREARERGYSWHDYELGSDVNDSSDEEADYVEVSSRRNLHKSRDQDTFHTWSERMRAIDDSNAESSVEGEAVDMDDDLTAVKKRLHDDSPSPRSKSPTTTLPQHFPSTSHTYHTHQAECNSKTTMTTTATQVSMTTRIPLQYVQQLYCSIDSQAVSSDVSPGSHLFLPFNDDSCQQQTPDSGAVSDICSGSIPPDTAPFSLSADIVTSDGFDSDTKKKIQPVCTQASHIKIANRGIPSCPNCQCSLVHYSIIPKEQRSQLSSTTFTHFNGGIMNTSEQAQINLHINETLSQAMKFHLDTLDKDGPGFVFIMTDSLQGFLPWSLQQRYKIASSRQPERWLKEFQKHNIDIDLIWQVKVKHHLLALREVHVHLQKYHLHSNWFKCSLSQIMDIISRVVRKYRI